ncbi:MAG: hypothetical protein NTV52_07105 [Acidobacteria bacterium]|nr:hypothetical protein [Acidobacteriota bacterium]
MKAVTEQARGVQQVATKVETLHRHVISMHDEMASADRSNAEQAKRQDDATILKTLTENKMNLAANATAKDRAALRMTAANRMSRTSMILSAAGKIGG